jgi:hypothetical protein
MPWSKQERADLLKRIHTLEAGKSNPSIDQAAYDALNADLSETFRAYAQGLPNESVSRCPICNTPIKVPIDPYGFDGPWWWSSCPTALPSPEVCKHFQLLQGAVDLHGRTPTEARDTARPGPAVPFVIGRVLSAEGMSAVISSRNLATGDTAYPILYFSSNPSPYPNLHQSWRSESLPLHNDEGRVIGWGTADDPWDFDLRKWADAGKLWWIAPGDGSLTLQKSSPSPFENLPGIRGTQLAVSGQLRVSPAPSGRGGSPYE